MKLRVLYVSAAFVLSALASGCDSLSPAPAPAGVSLVGESRGVVQQQAPLAVVVRDEDGGPVHGVEVEFQVLEGGGSILDPFAETNGEGVATTSITYGPDPGAVAIRVNVGEVSQTLVLDVLPPKADARLLVELPEETGDIVLDEARGRLYASLVPSREVIAVDLQTGRVTRRLGLDGPALNLRLSLDRTRLYVPACGAGTVVTVDLDTWTTEALDVSESTRGVWTWDAFEVKPGKLVVTDGAGCPVKVNAPHMGRLALVDLETGRWDPFWADGSYPITPNLIPTRGGEHLIVHWNGRPEGFSRVVLADVGVRDIPVDKWRFNLDNPWGNNGVRGGWFSATSTDGRYVFLGGGQVVEVGAWRVVHKMPWYPISGPFEGAHPVTDPDGHSVYYAMQTADFESGGAGSVEGTVKVFDAETFEWERDLRVPFNYTQAADAASAGRFYVLACGPDATCNDIYTVDPDRPVYEL
jgi:hypothetical protein